MRTFGEILKAKRIAIYGTQQALADRLGVAKNTVCAWERGKAYPSMWYAPALAAAFNCSLDELFGLEEAGE